MLTRRLAIVAVSSCTFIAATARAAEDSPGSRIGRTLSRMLGEPDEAFKKLDVDKDGCVQKIEFTDRLRDAGNGKIPAEGSGKLFDRADSDTDGVLSPEELQRLLTFTPSQPAPSAAEVKPAETPAVEKKAIVLESRVWKSGAAAALPPAKLDTLLDAARTVEHRAVAAALDDEQFLRRASLDLTGKPPTAADVEDFLRSTDPNKHVAAIDRLLTTDDFARHTAHFWRDVMQSKASSTQVVYELHRGAALEDWLFLQFQANRSWAEITRELITASGGISMPVDPQQGAVGFLLCHTGDDAAMGRAVDVTRVFLGMQLECAQCHDHPTDVWKREQFHELAAYFGRIRDGKAGAGRGIQLTSTARGEYEMPDKYDATKTTVTHPKFFLTGEALGEGSNDYARRQTLAGLVTADPWFAKAFVNRTWAQLMGRGFVEPVDNLGPSQTPIYPEVLDALAASFIASDFNVKELYATIVGSGAYRREVRFGETRHEHTHFAGAYPKRMRGEELWDTLATTVGPFAEKTPLPNGLREVLGRIRDPDFFTVFKRLFDYDPSAGANEIEPSVAQSLMLLNNPAINAQISAKGETPLARIVANYSQTDAAIRQVYLQVLSRSPSDDELKTCSDYVREVGDHGEALEDLMWTLVNGAEFRIKH